MPHKKPIREHLGLIAIAVMMVAFYLFNSSTGVMARIESDFFQQQSGYVSEIQERFHISDEPSVLYLDAGVAPYYLKANSSGRYICPLPFQRDSPNWNLTGTKAFQRTYADIVGYDGDYIIGDGGIGFADWIHSGYPDRAELNRKLKEDYVLVWEKGWAIYKKK